MSYLGVWYLYVVQRVLRSMITLLWLITMDSPTAFVIYYLIAVLRIHMLRLIISEESMK